MKKASDIKKVMTLLAIASSFEISACVPIINVDRRIARS